MQRRKFIKKSLQFGAFAAAASIGGCATWHHYFDGPLTNPCLDEALPDSLLEHELMQEALADIHFDKVWDSHFHLIGNGVKPAIDGKESGVWLSPNMTRWSSPLQRLQYGFYLDAACIDSSIDADRLFMQRSLHLLEQLPPGVRFMLLAFDWHHTEKGEIDRNMSTFYIPNQYAARMAQQSEQLEWIASVHPYREDALEQLEWCAEHGARAIKWLPPAMNIDPASRRCEAFYEKLLRLNLPLLTHAGEEKAVHSEELQKYGNPLLLRKPLEMGVRVIVAHCASLGRSEDIEAKSGRMATNFSLFSRLMTEKNYQNNLLADISAINLFNREISEIQQLLANQEWHSRLLFATDYPLPGVMPIVSATNLAKHGLLKQSTVPFLKQVRAHNAWLFDFLVKRFLRFKGATFSNAVFETARHFQPKLTETL